MFNWITKLGGDSSEREIKKLRPFLAQINALEADYQALSDEALRDKTTEFRGRFLAGESLDDLMPEAFAAVREAASRTIGKRHYDVQLLAGAVLHSGRIAEMRTGEGKTLVATLPLYLNAHRREGRPPGHAQRLSVATGRRLDGAGLRRARAEGRRHRPRVRRDLRRGVQRPAQAPRRTPESLAPGRASRGVRRGHHLRHQQRVWLRLSARQHGVGSRAKSAAALALRHRRRSRQHPRRRSAHAADHLGPSRRSQPAVRRVRDGGQEPGGGRPKSTNDEDADPDADVTFDEKYRVVTPTERASTRSRRCCAG